MPAIPVIMIGMAVASAAATAMTMEEQQKAAKQAAQTTTNVANYNAAIDMNQAKQNDIDSQSNADRQRASDKIYLSRQRSAIAANGLLTAGSPLDLLATTAGKMETGIQDQWRDTNMTDENLGEAAQAGIQEGRAQATQYQMQGQASLFSGIGQLAGNVSSAGKTYNSGGFGNN
jgi:hypothetical protein